MARKINMVKEEYSLPRTRQCELLENPRSTSYYQPKPVTTDDLELMERIDRIYTAQPLCGSRRIVDQSQADQTFDATDGYSGDTSWPQNIKAASSE